MVSRSPKCALRSPRVPAQREVLLLTGSGLALLTGSGLALLAGSGLALLTGTAATAGLAQRYTLTAVPLLAIGGTSRSTTSLPSERAAERNTPPHH